MQTCMHAPAQEQEAGHTRMGVDEQPEGVAEGVADPASGAAALLAAFGCLVSSS